MRETEPIYIGQSPSAKPISGLHNNRKEYLLSHISLHRKIVTEEHFTELRHIGPLNYSEF
jgi:hypothetical protein